MKKLLAVLLSFSLLSLPLASAEPSISPEELERALQLTGKSGSLIDNSIEQLTALDTSAGNMSETTDDLNLILIDSDANSGNLNQHVNDSEKISGSLSETIPNLKPSFWKSQLGRGIKWTGIVVLAFATGYGTSEIVGAIR